MYYVQTYELEVPDQSARSEPVSKLADAKAYEQHLAAKQDRSAYGTRIVDSKGNVKR